MTFNKIRCICLLLVGLIGSSTFSLASGKGYLPEMAPARKPLPLAAASPSKEEKVTEAQKVDAYLASLKLDQEKDDNPTSDGLTANVRLPGRSKSTKSQLLFHQLPAAYLNLNNERGEDCFHLLERNKEGKDNVVTLLSTLTSIGYADQAPKLGFPSKKTSTDVLAMGFLACGYQQPMSVTSEVQHEVGKEFRGLLKHNAGRRYVRATREVNELLIKAVAIAVVENIDRSVLENLHSETNLLDYYRKFFLSGAEEPEAKMAKRDIACKALVAVYMAHRIAAWRSRHEEGVLNEWILKHKYSGLIKNVHAYMEGPLGDILRMRVTANSALKTNFAASPSRPTAHSRRLSGGAVPLSNFQEDTVVVSEKPQRAPTPEIDAIETQRKREAEERAEKVRADFAAKQKLEEQIRIEEEEKRKREEEERVREKEKKEKEELEAQLQREAVERAVEEEKRKREEEERAAKIRAELATKQQREAVERAIEEEKRKRLEEERIREENRKAQEELEAQLRREAEEREREVKAAQLKHLEEERIKAEVLAKQAREKEDELKAKIRDSSGSGSGSRGQDDATDSRGPNTTGDSVNDPLLEDSEAQKKKKKKDCCTLL